VSHILTVSPRPSKKARTVASSSSIDMDMLQSGSRSFAHSEHWKASFSCVTISGFSTRALIHRYALLDAAVEDLCKCVGGAE
jgi:hypothetical protein